MDRKEPYGTLERQIRGHGAVLAAMRSLAQATLAVGAVALGIMIIGLGNLAIFMH